MWHSKPGAVSKAMCRLPFQAHFAGDMPADGRVAGRGPAPHLGSPGPRIPPGIELGPLEWPRTWSLREEKLTSL